jgi:uncharacterized tellurite resistance protein B-like protein
MDINQFTEQQKQVLLDLVTLAMYADGHLASAEDERVLRLLGSMGFATDYDRNQHYDAAITRVSRHSQTTESARAYAATLAETFTRPEQRRMVEEMLDDVVTSDRCVTPQESSLLSVVKEALQR